MGKGDWRRPCQVPKEEADANFERVFGKKKLNVMSDEDRRELAEYCKGTPCTEKGCKDGWKQSIDGTYKFRCTVCEGTGLSHDRDREASGDVPADGHDSGDLHAESPSATPHGCSCFGPHYKGNAACPVNRPFWTGPGYRGEYACPHGVGHGNHTHGCDGCCRRNDFPLRDSRACGGSH